MDNTPQMPQNITFPSRYFWRRFAAYIVDVTIFQAAILIAVYYFSATSPLDLLFHGWTSTQCTEAIPDQLAKRIEAGWPLKTGEIRGADICEKTHFGLGKQRYLRTGVAADTDGLLWSPELTIRLDADNKPVTKTLPAYRSLLSGIANTALIALAFAWFSANGRRTFGKALVFLRVQSVDGKTPDLGTAFKREILKFSPNLLFSAVAFAISLFPIYPTEDFDALLRMFREGYEPSDDSIGKSYLVWGPGGDGMVDLAVHRLGRTDLLRSSLRLQSRDDPKGRPSR
ncbi:RDD family protein [Rhizobium croatiense]|uniref:RDD family protein n=1 Tax=Rhizobium croatiense TaxID=2867516 RepID=UPI0028AF608E|nr:RDD family protein [Rhizobium croatiense]